ncbi:MAG: hypothetical protein ACOCRK_01500 [bacterium]
MKRKVSLILLIMILSFNVLAAETEDLYSEAIQSINNWIESIPKDQYRSATDNEIFMWKVEIENSGGVSWDSESSYSILEKLANEIGNKQFIYENITFNKNSINFFQLQNYIKFYNYSYSDIPKPDDFFIETLEYYKGNISSVNEQWEWLYGFLQMLSFQEYYTSATLGPGTKNENFLNNLKSEYDNVLSVVNLYIILGDDLLTNNPTPILKSGRLYYDYAVNTYGRNLEVNVFLGQLYNFVYHWQDILSEDDKKRILNQVVPKYQNNDFAVKIYSLLN